MPKKKSKTRLYEVVRTTGIGGMEVGGRGRLIRAKSRQEAATKVGNEYGNAGFFGQSNGSVRVFPVRVVKKKR